MRASLSESFHVGDHQFGVDGVDIGNRVDGVADMGNIVILETTDHMSDGVYLTDVPEKFIAQSFALRRALDESSDVDKLHGRGNNFIGLDVLGDDIQTFIRNRHDAAIGFAGGERIISRQGFGSCQSAEQS